MPYKVSRTGQFNLAVIRLGKKVPRLDEFISGLAAILAAKPDAGKETSLEGVFALAMNRRQGEANVVAFYTFRNNEVLLHALRLDGDENPAPWIL